MKHREDFAAVQFLPILNGGLGLFHRPPLAALRYFKEHTPCTTVFTLQSTGESPNEVKHYCEKLGLQWVWVDLRGANKPLLKSKETFTKVKTGLLSARARLQQGEFVLIHCAAGVHRTGTFAYALLRIAGTPAEEIPDLIGTMRAETLRGCGAARFEIAEDFALRILSKEQHSELPGFQLSSAPFEQGLLWARCELGSKGAVQLLFLATNAAVDEYTKGPKGRVRIKRGVLTADLGTEMMELFSSGVDRAMKEYKLGHFQNELATFCKEHFVTPPLLIGKNVALISLFLSKYMKPAHDLLAPAVVELTSFEQVLGVNFSGVLEEDIQVLQRIRTANVPV